MLSRHFLMQFLLLAVLSVPAMARGDALLRGTVESLRDAKSAFMDEVPLASGRLLADFYGARDYRPAWIRSDQVESLRSAAEGSSADGLIPQDFHLERLSKLAPLGVLDRLSPARRVAAEIQLSDALLRYVYQIRLGRLDPVAVNPAWNHRPAVPAETLIRSMESVASAADPAAGLAALAPRPFFYENLKRALDDRLGADHLRDLSPIPTGEHLARGSRNPQVALLRERLRLLGHHAAADPDDPERFDDELRRSLIAFQRRFGLSADGVAGPSTIAALNRPYDSSTANKVRINLERMRWFYDSLPSDYVLVDVAGFMVHVIRDHGVSWSTRVVVGTPEQQTPSFRDEMEHLVFNPTWTVPPSIQEKMRSVPSRYKVVDRRTGRAVRGGNISDHRRYRLVQEAGPGNALGRVKFMFPNGHAIYLHDTPSKGLFRRRTRAYSHGCVRVQDPLKLAEVILGQRKWDQSEINRVVRTNKTRYVYLEEHLPVILYYLTAYADPHGELGFRRDIYGRDGALLRAIDGPPSPLRIAFPKPTPLPETIPAAGTLNAEAKPAAVPPYAEPKSHDEAKDQGTGSRASAPSAVASPPGTTLTLDVEIRKHARGLETSIAPRHQSEGAQVSRSANTL